MELNALEIWNTIDHDSDEKSLDDFFDAGGDLYFEHPSNGWTFLHLACDLGNERLIRLLIDRGFDLNFVSSSGYPAIFQALDLDLDSALQRETLPDFKWVTFLVEHGAHLDSLRRDGISLRAYCSIEYIEPFAIAFDRVFKK